MNRTITKATPQQVDDIMNVIAAAKQIMRQSGNLHQWADSYPSTDVILHDIEVGGGYVVEDDGIIVAYFAFFYLLWHYLPALRRRTSGLSENKINTKNMSSPYS